MVVLALPAGMMLISASAPGTTGAAAPNPAYPAVYAVTLNHSSHVAFVRPLFYDESQATAANGPHGAFYATDHDADTVDVIVGTFRPGTALVAVTPCGANNAPATCPGPGFPANYLGQLNMHTGQITRVKLRGASLEPQGLIFAAR
jgi:hypothetical protein